MDRGDSLANRAVVENSIFGTADHCVGFFHGCRCHLQETDNLNEIVNISVNLTVKYLHLTYYGTIGNILTRV